VFCAGFGARCVRVDKVAVGGAEFASNGSWQSRGLNLHVMEVSSKGNSG